MLQKKYVLTLVLTAVITTIFIGTILSLPDFGVKKNKCLVVTIPDDLLYELNEESIVIAQHGYKHTYNVTNEEKQDGFDLLVSQGLKPTKYIAPYEWDNSHPFLLVFNLSQRSEDSEIPWKYSEVGVDNQGRSVLVVHIQDDIENYQMKIFDSYDVIRVDDVNTDITPSGIQAQRVKILKEYAKGNNKTIVLGVIPYVQRLPWFYGIASWFLKILFVVWMLLILPYYVFYLISWRLL